MYLDKVTETVARVDMLAQIAFNVLFEHSYELTNDLSYIFIYEKLK